MAAVNGSYVHERSENLEALLKAIGAKEERIQKMVAAHPKVEVNLSGDQLTIKSVGDEKIENVITLGTNSTFKVAGDLEIQVNVAATGNKSIKGTISKGAHTGEITVEFDGTNLIETFVVGPITSKRVYKRV